MNANGQCLGDLGQDITSHEDEIYIAVNGSQTIFVTDKDLKIRHQINTEKDRFRLSPRFFATSGSKVYVTYYEGYIGEISSDYTVKLYPVCPNPEVVAVADGNIYVANSDGMAYPFYNNTISVVSISSFTETSTIVVNDNPAKAEASSDGSYVYVSSFRNYSDTPAKLQVISLSDGSVSDLEYSAVSTISKGRDDILYILCGGYDENRNPLPGTVYKHDMKTNMSLWKFITDGTSLPDTYSISITSDGYVYVGYSDYVNTGDVYIFTPEGILYDKFDSQGLNPLLACDPL